MQVNLKTYLSILKQVSHEWFDNFFLFATALVHNVKPLVILIRLMKIEHTESIQTICEWAKPTESIYAICLRKLQTALKTKTAKRKPFVWRRYDVSKKKNGNHLSSENVSNVIVWKNERFFRHFVQLILADCLDGEHQTWFSSCS